MNATLQPAGSRRVRFFFSLGMLILPPFWAWWTLCSRFTPRQQTLAFLWANAYLLLVFFTWNVTGERILVAVFHYRDICGTLAFALCIWLIARVVGLPNLLIFCVVGFDIIAMLASTITPAYEKLAHRSPVVAEVRPWLAPAWVLAFALLHLAVDPVRKLHARFSQWWWAKAE